MLGVLVAMGPGGLDSRLYWRTSTATIQAASPETRTPETSALDAEVGAVRGAADTPSLADDEAAQSGGVLDADSASPESTPPGETFPPLAPELQESFRKAWFDGATEADLLTAPATTEAPGTEAPETTAPAGGVSEQGTPEVQGQPAPAGVEGAPVVAGEVVAGEVVVANEAVADEAVADQAVAADEAVADEIVADEIVADQYGYPPVEGEYVPSTEGEEAAMDELVVVPRGALLPREYMGTDPRYDPFVNDARRNEGSRGPLRGAWTGGAWTGAATTGGAWTGGATTGAATRGGAWTGGAWTGGATTGGAWTGGAWTGGATTGGAWTGGAWRRP